ncbi:MAG TPA: transposase, partial [Polyangiales bacterium]
MTTRCEQCDELRQMLATALAEIATLRAQLAEAMKHIELQRADIERYKEAYEQVRPNHPERVPQDQLQLAFEELLVTYGPPANDTAIVPSDASSDGDIPAGEKKRKKKKRHAHGRRRLDLSTLPVELVKIEPPEVLAAGGVGFVRIGEEVSDRVAHRPATYIRLRIARGKWIETTTVVEQTATEPVSVEQTETASEAESPVIEQTATEPAPEVEPMPERSPVLVAPLPESVWPHVMADPSAIAAGIISKYDDSLPLNRQERISTRQGFPVPRSTLCSWFSAACSYTGRIVDAMFAEAKSQSFCIATDATGAPVRAPKSCVDWHVFVFIADRDHVVFRYVQQETSVAVTSLLSGFRGYLLSDAAPVYDALHRGGDVVEVCCWFHCRRYFYRALESDRERALAVLSIISKLFEVDRECRDIPMPERTSVR